MANIKLQAYEQDKTKIIYAINRLSTAVDTIQGTAPPSTAFLPLTGGTLTGPLTITPSPAGQALTVTGNTTHTGNETVTGAMLVGTVAAPNQGGGTTIGGSLITASNYFGINAYFDTAVSGSWTYYTSNYALLWFMSGGQHFWYGAPSGTAGTAISWTQRMVLDTGGSLTCAGNITAGATVSGVNTFGTSNLYAGSSGPTLGGQTGSVLTSTSYLQVDSAGIRYMLWNPGYNGISWRYSVDQGGAVSAIVDNTTVAPAYPSSDERLKHEIGPSTHDCLKTVKEISLHEYRWKNHSVPADPQPDPNGRHAPIGVIAQNLHKHAPHLVMKGDDLPLGEHEPITKLFVPWGLDTASILATLIGAVQQLAARVEALEARLPAS